MMTVQVIPALINTPSGTSVRRMRTGTRCASRTQVNVGLREQLRSVFVVLVGDAARLYALGLKHDEHAGLRASVVQDCPCKLDAGVQWLRQMVRECRFQAGVFAL
jgi:hypothetical protein